MIVAVPSVISGFTFLKISSKATAAIELSPEDTVLRDE